MRNGLEEYGEEVIDEIAGLGHYSEVDARNIAKEKREDIEYGYKYRLSASIVAGAILGINDCCISGSGI